MQHALITGLLLAGLSLAGCHGNINTIYFPEMAMEPAMGESRPVVAVDVFRDQRIETERLGIHVSWMGRPESIRMSDDNLGHSVAQRFIHFLNHRGFAASAATDTKSPDIRVKADIIEFNVDVIDRMLYSSLEVSVTMTFVIQNVADNSTIRATIVSGEISNEVFFNHHEMEDLINAMLTEGFMKLLLMTKAQGGPLAAAHHIRFAPHTVVQSGTVAHVPAVPLIAPPA